MPIPVIIDTDPGVDDIVALLYALTSPELEILAIVVSFGNTDVDSSYDNVLKLFTTLSNHFDKHPEVRERFPNFSFDKKPILVKGENGPLEGALHSAQYFHGRDGLGDISKRHPDISILPPKLNNNNEHNNHNHNPNPDFPLPIQLSDKPGHELALELLSTYPARSITYIALGPLTTLSRMFRMNREVCRDRIGRVIIMGGALDVPGNTSPVAEFNFFADPYAVKELLINNDEGSGGLPLTRTLLLPLDITTPHEFTFPQYTQKIDPTFTLGKETNPREKSPLVHFTSAFLERTREVMREFGKDVMELHDVVAIWCATQNPPEPIKDSHNGPTLQPGWKSHRRLFQIERTGELTRGMLVVDRRDEVLDQQLDLDLKLKLDLETSNDPNIKTNENRRFKTGDNRAEVQTQLDRQVHDLPAPVQVEFDAPPHVHPKGVACVVQTPGTEALVASMFSRIWGVESL